MDTIQTLSRRLRLLFQFLLVMVPVGVIYFWLVAGTESDIHPLLGIGTDVSLYTDLTLSFQTRLIVLTLSLLLALIPLYALVKLVRLFKNYEQTDVFTLENATIYHQLGRCLLLWVVAGIIYGGLMSAALSFNNKPGERFLELDFGGYDALGLICAFLIIVISQVMKTGYQIAEENSHTV